LTTLLAVRGCIKLPPAAIDMDSEAKQKKGGEKERRHENRKEVREERRRKEKNEAVKQTKADGSRGPETLYKITQRLKDIHKSQVE
jgi:hypothetical protein